MAKPNRTSSRSSQKDQVKKTVRKQVEDYLNHLHEQGLTIQRAFIFGSRVKRGGQRWSDIDVCVISPDFGPHNDALAYLWQSLRKQDIKAGIEPVGFHPDDFVEDLPLVHEILRHGVRVI